MLLVVKTSQRINSSNEGLNNENNIINYNLSIINYFNFEIMYVIGIITMKIGH